MVLIVVIHLLEVVIVLGLLLLPVGLDIEVARLVNQISPVHGHAATCADFGALPSLQIAIHVLGVGQLLQTGA